METTLKSLREKVGITQAEAAKALFVNTQNISNWERRTTMVPMRHWRRLSRLYKVHVNVFIDMKLERTAQKIRKAFSLK